MEAKYSVFLVLEGRSVLQLEEWFSRGCFLGLSEHCVAGFDGGRGVAEFWGHGVCQILLGGFEGAHCSERL
jgi:hypothetical protein